MTTTRPATTRTVPLRSALLLVLALLLGACGSGDDTAAPAADGGSDSAIQGGGDADAATATTEATTTSEAPATTAATTEAPTTEAPTTAAPATSDADSSKTGGAEALAALTAARESADDTSVRFEGSIAVDGLGGESAVMTTAGTIHVPTNSMEMELDLSGFLAAAAAAEGQDLAGMEQFFAEPIRMRTVDDRSYLQWSLFSLIGGLGPDTWVEMSEDEAADFSGELGAGPTSPTAILEGLEAVDAEVEDLGLVDLRGVEVRHIRAVIDPDRLPEGSDLTGADAQDLDDIAEMPLEIWVDESGQMHRLVMTVVSAEALEGEPSSITMTYDFFDHGDVEPIAAPDPASVVQGSELGL